ncbi:hypothetical protein [uncultured Muribaculum sp.]|uniref:hypothetical protein n=1 Tax=uncultured Muribaculum sp. TaxID=1918613 RepID=UPI00258D0D41|nr:hypothetical protein [uncultured Muribaculum sp.]
MKKYILLSSFIALGLFASAQKFEPEWAGEVAVLKVDGDTLSIPTEKSIPQVKTSASAGRLLVGIGNIRRKAVLKNGRATTQIPQTGTITLVVRCKDNETDPTTFIQLVKFEEKKKERKTELANVNWLGNVSEGNMEYINFNGKKYGKSSYILTFPAQEGEYGVRVLNPNDRDEKTTVFYCFGIHPEDCLKSEKSEPKDLDPIYEN